MFEHLTFSEILTAAASSSAAHPPTCQLCLCVYVCLFKGAHLCALTYCNSALWTYSMCIPHRCAYISMHLWLHHQRVVLPDTYSKIQGSDLWAGRSVVAPHWARWQSLSCLILPGGINIIHRHTHTLQLCSVSEIMPCSLWTMKLVNLTPCSPVCLQFVSQHDSLPFCLFIFSSLFQLFFPCSELENRSKKNKKQKEKKNKKKEVI